MQPKRRRSSAAPVLGRANSRKAPISQPVLVEESEPEEEDQDEIVVRKVGRSKKSVSLFIRLLQLASIYHTGRCCGNESATSLG